MLSLSCLKAPTLSLCPRVQARPFLTAFGALCGKWATHPVRLPQPIPATPTLCLSHTGAALCSPDTPPLALVTLGPSPSMPLECPFTSLSPAHSSGSSVQTPLLSGSLPGFSRRSYSLPFLSPFRPFVRGSLLLFPFECAFWRTRAFFLTMSHFLLWVPVTQDKSIREAFPSPLGMTPVCRRQAVLPRSLAKCFSSPSLLLSRNYSLGG